MPSKARLAFAESVKDVDRLLEIHKDLGGGAPGRRFRLEVLNKSAVVLLTAIWEAYCEDIASEALDHIVNYAPNSDSLTEEIKKQIAEELKKDQTNKTAVWKLSGDGWKAVLKDRFKNMTEDRNRQLSTPKSYNIDKLFVETIGLKDISSVWKWHTMSSNKAKDKLNKYITLRGDIAHRGKALAPIKKSDVQNYLSFIKRVVGKTGGKVNAHVVKITKRSLW